MCILRGSETHTYTHTHIRTNPLAHTYALKHIHIYTYIRSIHGGTERHTYK